MKFRSSHSASVVCVALSLAATVAHAQVTVADVSGPDVTAGGVTVWRGVLNSSGTQYMVDTGDTNPGPVPSNPGLLDNQTGQKVADIVGTATQPTIYIGHLKIGTTDHIAFRMRLNVFADVGSLKQSNYIGFDFGTTATNTTANVADMFVGVDVVSQQSNQWRIVIIDTTGNLATDNTSPNTTNFSYSNSIAPLRSFTLTSTNFNYQQVTAQNSTVGGLTEFPDAANSLTTPAPDAFLSFAIPYADFVSAVRDPLVMGSGFTFDVNTTYRVTAATGNQSNNINQDSMANPALAFQFSTPMNTSGTIGSTINPIPEPSTFVLSGALLAPWLLRRRRRTAV